PACRTLDERVTVPPRILGSDQALLSRKPDEQRAPLGEQRLGETRLVFARAQIPAQPQLVVKRVARARVAAELRLDLLQGAGIDQVPQLLLPEQLAQEVAVERQRLRPPFGGRRVVLVHVGGDVVEEKRRGVRRRGGGL